MTQLRPLPGKIFIGIAFLAVVLLYAVPPGMFSWGNN